MKKIFALALAAVMTAGMTTVAFAADGVYLAKETGKVVYFVDADDNGIFEADEKNATDLEGGEKVAILLYSESDCSVAATKDDVKGYKVNADWLINEPGEKAAIDEIVYKDSKSATTYQAVVFTLPEMDENKEIELVGKVGVYKTTANKDKDMEAISIKVGADAVDFSAAQNDDFNKGPVKFEENKVKINDVVNATFGDEAEFEVDVTGQGKLNLAWNTDFNKEFGEMYDYANIDFLTFEYTPSFNKTGTFYIYASEDAFIYEVTADGAKEIKGLAWDEDYEAWTFKTRTLKSYAISDVELTEKTVTEDKADGGKTNPDTGR